MRNQDGKDRSCQVSFPDRISFGGLRTSYVARAFMYKAGCNILCKNCAERLDMGAGSEYYNTCRPDGKFGPGNFVGE